MSSISRRQLLAAGAAGLTLLTADKAFSQEAAAKKLRVAFCGVGGRGSDNLKAISALATVAAICDVDGNTLGGVAKRFPDAKTFFDYRAMLQQADRFDAVAISIPDHMHTPVALAAIALGKHVYCEKPLTHDIAEARQLAQAAAAKGVRTQMGNTAHSSDSTRMAVEWIRAGAVGAVKEIHVWSDRPVNWWPQGFARPTRAGAPPAHLHWDLLLGTAPEMPYYINEQGQSLIHPFKWRGWWNLGTGALGDMGCHIFNVSYWACALEKAKTITVEAKQEGNNELVGPSWSIISYRFSGPDFAPIDLTWYDGGKQPARPPELEADREWGKILNGTLFVGDKGTLLVPHGQVAPRLIPESRMKEFKRPEPTIPRIAGGGAGHHRDWVEACIEGRESSSNFAHAGPLAEIVLLGNVAIRAGKKVTLDRPSLKLDDPALEKLIKREYRRTYAL